MTTSVVEKVTVLINKIHQGVFREHGKKLQLTHIKEIPKDQFMTNLSMGLL